MAPAVEPRGMERGYLIPHDAKPNHSPGYVDMSEVQDACYWINAKHILIVLDCCFSGIAAVAARATPGPGPSIIDGRVRSAHDAVGGS